MNETFKALLSLLQDHTKWKIVGDGEYTRQWLHENGTHLSDGYHGELFPFIQVSGTVHGRFGIFSGRGKILKALDKLQAEKLLYNQLESFKD